MEDNTKPGDDKAVQSSARKLTAQAIATLEASLTSPRISVTSAELVALISTAEMRVAQLAEDERNRPIKGNSIVPSGVEYWERKAEMLATAARLVGESEGPHFVMLSDIQRLLLSPFDLPGTPYPPR